MESPDTTLASGTYEVLRNRLREAATDLRLRFEKLNAARADVFGNIETRLQATAHVTTDHNCVPRDLMTFGSRVILGYNVQFGLKTEIAPSDVLGLYRFDGEHTHQEPLSSILDERFHRDFQELYRYYRGTQFSRFYQRGPNVYMVFQVGKTPSDIKTFKWALDGSSLRYIDNRSESEVRQAEQHAFRWTRATREHHRQGLHPHVSIEDRVFVECVGGDLTIKVEDNTEDGLGIFREPVENADQTLDDAEIYYAIPGDLVILKIRPYQERDFRYFVFSTKRSEARRLDSVGQACVLLPDDHGIIFPNGFCLQTGECKLFDHGLTELAFERVIPAPNGEDLLFLFFQASTGTYLQLRYNLIRRAVDTPLVCHGQAFFDDGRMLTMRANEAPQKHHALQLWQTPYTSPNYQLTTKSDSMLFKIGNRDLVRGMSECQEILELIDKDESYIGLYADLVKRATDILDAYFWLDREEAFSLATPIATIREAASAAVDEFEKVVRVKQETSAALAKAQAETDELLKAIDRSRFEKIDDYVEKLAAIRSGRGNAIQLRERRYIEIEQVEKIEHRLGEASDRLGNRCVQFLLSPHALTPYRDQIEQSSGQIALVDSSAAGKKIDEQINTIAAALELLIETVSQLKIEDLTQRTSIIDNIGDVLSNLNRVRSTLKARVRDLTTHEMEADFASQTKLLDQATSGALETATTPELVDSALARILVQLEELEGRYSESDTLLLRLTEKRQSLCEAFEDRRQHLVEERTRRADALVQAADRILASIVSRAQRIDEAQTLHAYFASDPMVDKVRRIGDQLNDLGDSVRMDDVLSRLKSVADDAVRMQRDRRDLLSDGNRVIRLGQHGFSVNQQPTELTTVVRNGRLQLHLTGTQFFQPLEDAALDSSKDLWTQTLISESPEVYRGEYLAYTLFQQIRGPRSEVDMLPSKFLTLDTELQTKWVRETMQVRHSEGYSRGVHDHDASRILAELLKMEHDLGLLTYDPKLRSETWFVWTHFVPEADKKAIEQWVASCMTVESLLPRSKSDKASMMRIAKALRAVRVSPWTSVGRPSATEYLLKQLKNGEPIASPRANLLLQRLSEHFPGEDWTRLVETLAKYQKQPDHVWQFGLEIVDAYLQGLPASDESTQDANENYREEIAGLLIEATQNANKHAARASAKSSKMHEVAVARKLSGLVGDHPRIQQGSFVLHFHEFSNRLRKYTQRVIPRIRLLQSTKQHLLEDASRRLRAHEFKARVLTSFVRNQLIDQVYLPRVGDNLAKQIGAAGDNKRTDRMGLLLLVSPPGYGKTTLMEYIANRLGLVFVKVNGPALGHDVTSLDPAEAPNASAREEVQRINLALEMGDNVMLYLDDIQHCDPELLQKFIPLCDATRRIEGVWNGKPQTYDLRGRKFAVVMAGNPYTESGQRFQVPDMLANRADVYNLGEIIGNSREAFELSYLENCLTSNSILLPLARCSNQDQRALIEAAARGTTEGLSLESNLSHDQVNEMMSVLRKLHRVRDVVLKMNREYIRSAAQADDYRTEPPFKLQGSYRNMNRIAEKIVPVMNDSELETLILSSYQQDAQTLSRDGESNMLKFKELLGLLTDDERARWDSIRYTFTERSRLRGLPGDDSTVQVLSSLMGLRDGLESIRKALGDAVTAAYQDQKTDPPELPEQRVIVQHSVPRVMTDLIRSQFQLLYDGLRPVLEQSVRQSQSQERLKAAIDDCLERYRNMESEALAAEANLEQDDEEQA